MPLPDYQTVMLPLLELVADSEPLRLQDALPIMSDHFKLSDAERAETISSGRSKMLSRVLWAGTYLAQARAVSRPRRGYIAITDRGRELLASKPERIDYTLLKQFPEFAQFLAGSKKDGSEPSVPTFPSSDPGSELSPEELLDQGYRALRADVEAALLDRLRTSTPEFFEQTVVKLLVAMGYGGSHDDAARSLGSTGDEGIDGVIDEDQLGLDAIYIQAKRWKADHTVGRPDLQGFVGSLVGKKASKGVFITTSSFSQQAKGYLESIGQRVVLIDGAKVAELMFTHGVGVRTRDSYLVKEVDDSFFDAGA